MFRPRPALTTRRCTRPVRNQRRRDQRVVWVDRLTHSRVPIRSDRADGRGGIRSTVLSFFQSAFEYRSRRHFIDAPFVNRLKTRSCRFLVLRRRLGEHLEIRFAKDTSIFCSSGRILQYCTAALPRLDSTALYRQLKCGPVANCAWRFLFCSRVTSE